MMGLLITNFLFLPLFFMLFHMASTGFASCSNRQCKLLEKCSEYSDCGRGLSCFSCKYARPRLEGSRCVRSTVTSPFKIVVLLFVWCFGFNCCIRAIYIAVCLNNSMPFNRYAFLTTHNSFAIKREEAGTEAIHITFTNQEDSITQQLNSGVRALMLDTYDYKGDVWLCHSFKGKCHAFTAFGPALDTLKEIEAFMSSNPSEIVTLILEDHVETPNALTRVLKEAGLMKYWFPLSSMPKKGQDWPLVKDMVAKNQRLIVFTSMQHKQQTEGIAYQWKFMVENQYGNHGMEPGRCPNRNEFAQMNDHSKSLILVNHFRTIPLRLTACKDNSGELIEMLHTCYAAADNRWANFVAVDHYKRSDGGGVFKAIDTLNGELLCGCADVHACKAGSSLNTSAKYLHQASPIRSKF